MWHPEVLHKIAERSLHGASLATFTAAGEVRRGLENAGFTVRKRKGFGRKREMLCATLESTSQQPGVSARQPWFEPPNSPSPVREVAVVGAGIAGAQTAWHLAQQGIRVTLFEAHEEIARGASGNPAGILAPRLTAAPGRGEQFYLAAFYYQLRQLGMLRKLGHEVAFDACGLLQLAYTDSGENRIQMLGQREDLPPGIETLTSRQVSDILGEQVRHPGVRIDAAGALSPRSLAAALLARQDIRLMPASRVDTIEDGPAGPVLRLFGGEPYQFDAIVLTNGEQAAHFCEAVKIIPVRGQTSSARLAEKPVPTPAIDHSGYLVRDPLDPQTLVFGATYLRDDASSDLRDSDTLSNSDILAEALPQLYRGLNRIRSCHAGVRATTPDRWPVVGPLPNTAFYLREYGDLHMGKHYKHYPPARYRSGVFMLSGLGSRGLASAAYCANLLTQLILGASLTAPLDEYYAMHPARFLVRGLRRKAGGQLPGEKV